MTVWEWLGALWRRWPVLVVGLLCTASAVYLVHKRTVSWEACASVIVGAPNTPSSPNQYNDPEASLVAATGLITDKLQAPQVQQRLQAEGATATYQAVMHNTGTTETVSYDEPEMDVCATSPDPAMALRTTNAVVAEFGALMRSGQVAAHVAPKNFLTESVLAAPGAIPEAGRPSQAYLGVGVIGLVATASIAVWSDQYLRRRQRRRGRADVPGPGAGAQVLRSR
jgi:hypothetical protein